MSRSELGPPPPAPQRVERDRQDPDRGEEGGRRERGDRLVLGVGPLHVQRERVRLSDELPGDDRHGAELAGGARGAEDDAVDDGGADRREHDSPERLPAVRAEHRRRLLLRALELVQRGQDLSRHVGERHDDGREDEPGPGEEHLHVRGPHRGGEETDRRAPGEHDEETASGRSSATRTSRASAVRRRATTHAAASPKTVLAGTAIATTRSVSFAAWRASGAESPSTNPATPRANAWP